ncbi:heme exporter protein CcmD [Achromobacter sp. Marseille-Q4962]|uniref:heme exporter protein CcmD n=1 Tax=Achromobacter sp. Marseille-Q4962 TaxID=2942202 RepID=UPI002073495D|nr:heme exporter protein CcmD [Achromobacter sp. Marseille-Q4962]
MSWDALFSPGGHGPYLLGAYGVFLALLGLEAWMLWRAGRRRRRAGSRRRAGEPS